MANIATTAWHRIVWETVAQTDQVHSIEHPVLNIKMPKGEFAKEFAAVLKELDGRSLTDFVDFFFEPDCVDRGTLCFRGEDERQDFFDWAVETGCCPPLAQIKSGDDDDREDDGEDDGEDKGRGQEEDAGVTEAVLLEREIAQIWARREAELDRARKQREAKQRTQQKRSAEPPHVKMRRMLVGRAKGLQTLQEKLRHSEQKNTAKLLSKLQKAKTALQTAYSAHRQKFPVIAEVEHELSQ